MDTAESSPPIREPRLLPRGNLRPPSVERQKPTPPLAPPPGATTYTWRPSRSKATEGSPPWRFPLGGEFGSFSGLVNERPPAKAPDAAKHAAAPTSAVATSILDVRVASLPIEQ